MSPDLPNRRSPRLKGYDYRRPGAYFFTTNTAHRECLFGRFERDRLVRSPFGDIAHNIWHTLPRRFPGLTLDEFVVMPNHVHGIVWLAEHPLLDAAEATPAPRPGLANASPGRPLSDLRAVIGTFKSYVTLEINRARSTPGAPVWQRSFHERVVRSERALAAIRRYIRNNPVRALRGT